jgi:hypothetical protein
VASFLPGPWIASTDPVVAAMGDGPSDEPKANALAQSITAAGPDLFLFLGDIYEKGTFTENLNHYGQNSMDGGPGTLWGQMGTITQPTIGNHEGLGDRVDWQDYFHGRPLYTSFRFGNVLFFYLASSRPSMKRGKRPVQLREGDPHQRHQPASALHRDLLLPHPRPKQRLDQRGETAHVDPPHR